MARKKGAYGSLVRGVSEQVPHDRLDGQHWDQVNFLSDPIRGLVRRRGSMYRDKQSVGTEAPNAAALKLIRAIHEVSFTASGVDYSAFYSTAATGDLSDPNRANLPPMYCTNRDTQQLLPVRFVETEAEDAARNGLTSSVSLGRYILFSRRDFIPTYSTTDKVAENDGRAAVWIRGGDYSRTYTLTVNGTTASHTTMASYYEGTLDTSDINTGDPDYQKKVNDRVHAYNTAVNQHIAAAQESIQPENIAQALLDALDAAGLSAVTDSIVGSHIFLTGVDTISGDDGGDQSFMRITHRKVGSTNELTRMHYVGTTVAVEVTEDDVYYVQADAKTPGETGYKEVIWRESAGMETLPLSVFLIGTIHAGELVVSATPGGLAADTGLEVPEFQPSDSGDHDSNPVPEFFDRPITHMAVFQDRLLLAAGATVFMSKNGDYFNFFRKSVLRVAPDDPIEVFALGSEDDVIHGGTVIDRNVVLVGEKYHYAIPGRDAMTPNNAVISIQAAYEGTTDADPKALAGLMFYGQFRGGLTKLHQMQTGAFADSFISFSVTQQITRYIMGRPRQLAVSTQPKMVVMTTDMSDYGLYVYTFLDSPGQEERLFDSWSRWEWGEEVGKLLGITESEDGFSALLLRECTDGWYVVLDEFSRDPSAPDEPYLDSLVKYDDLATWAEPPEGVEKFSVLPRTHPRRLHGRDLADVQLMLDLDDVESSDIWVGLGQYAFYEPTSPYIRDRQGTAQLSGRTVLTSLQFSLEESAGIRVWRSGRDGVYDERVLDDAGFRVADPLATLGSVPILSRQVRCFVGKEIREHRLKVEARTWTPLNIATVEWVSQTFNR